MGRDRCRRQRPFSSRRHHTWLRYTPGVSTNVVPAGCCTANSCRLSTGVTVTTGPVNVECGLLSCAGSGAGALSVGVDRCSGLPSSKVSKATEPDDCSTVTDRQTITIITVCRRWYNTIVDTRNGQPSCNDELLNHLNAVISCVC